MACAGTLKYFTQRRKYAVDLIEIPDISVLSRWTEVAL